ICSAIRKWIGKGSFACPHNIHFIYTPSKLEWDIHHEAHCLAKNHKVRITRRTSSTLDYARKKTVARMLDEWNRLIRTPNYCGHQFIHHNHAGLPMRPTHIKGGPWLETIGTSNSHTARMTRSLTNHAPIGEYRMRFKIHGQLWCDCNAYIVQKRYHILHTCERNVRSKDRRVDDDFKDFMEFLERNPT